MTNVIDIFSKKKQPIDYNTRVKTCNQNIKDNGKCKCDICLYKKELMRELVLITIDKCKEFSDDKNPLYITDIQDILNTSSRHFKEIACFLIEKKKK